MSSLLNTLINQQIGTSLLKSFLQITEKASIPPKVATGIFAILLCAIIYVLVNYTVSKGILIKHYSYLCWQRNR